MKIWPLIAAWLVGTALLAGGLIWREWGQSVVRFERDVGNMHRLVAQRIDQHDAHMTGLSALIAVSDPPPVDAIRAVVSNISQFYPRITGIDIVRLSPSGTVFTTRSSAEGPPRSAIDYSLRENTTGAVTLPHPGSRYLIIKRAPQSASSRYVLVLEIDAAKLVDADADGSLDIALVTATSGDAIFKSQRWVDVAPPRSLRLETERRASSQSQPLDLWLRRDVPIISLVTLNPLLLLAALLAGVLWLLRTVVDARRSAAAAGTLAQFRTQEARLAHATRINAMGELSLGVAHELAQPLAALLAQSQAGLRIARSDKPDLAAIESVLEANVRLSKRAGILLAKLRDWVSANPRTHHVTNLDETIAGMVALNAEGFEKADIALIFHPSNAKCIAAADTMGIEQIVQNLMTNARDACRDAEPRGTSVSVSVFAQGDRTGFSVADDAAGIPAAVAAKLFEPFTTTKADGMGLGLSISRRLVEQFQGTITAGTRSDNGRGTVFTVVLPVVKVDRAV